jgi:hypothetical protein
VWNTYPSRFPEFFSQSVRLVKLANGDVVERIPLKNDQMLAAQVEQGDTLAVEKLAVV